MKNIIFAFLFLFSDLLFAQTTTLGSYQNWCQSGGQAVITQGMKSQTKVQASFPNCTVTVYQHGTTNIIPLFSDESSTPLTNPFTANDNGNFIFYAATGEYPVDVVTSGAGITTPFTYSNVNAPGAGGGSPPASPAFSVQASNSGVNGLVAVKEVQLNPNLRQQVEKLPRINALHTDFGAGCANAADPLGVEDSTCAITAAFNYANTGPIHAQSKSCIYVPAGIYLLSSPVNVPVGSFCLIGDSTQSTIFKVPAGTQDVFTFQGTGAPSGSSVLSGGAYVSNIQVTGSGLDNTGVVFDLINTTDATFNHVIISNWGGRGANLYGNSERNNFYDLKCEECNITLDTGFQTNENHFIDLFPLFPGAPNGGTQCYHTGINCDPVTHTYPAAHGNPSCGPYASNAWTANAVVAKGTIVCDANHNLEVATISGTTGSSVPSWPATAYTSICDGSTGLCSANITGFSQTSNIVTIQAINAFTVGQTVTFSGMTTGTYLNGVTLVILATGLSGTQFEAAITHADVNSTPDSGLATPTNVAYYKPDWTGPVQWEQVGDSTFIYPDHTWDVAITGNKNVIDGGSNKGITQTAAYFNAGLATHISNVYIEASPFGGRPGSNPGISTGGWDAGVSTSFTTAAVATTTRIIPVVSDLYFYFNHIGPDSLAVNGNSPINSFALMCPDYDPTIVPTVSCTTPGFSGFNKNSIERFATNAWSNTNKGYVPAGTNGRCTAGSNVCTPGSGSGAAWPSGAMVMEFQGGGNTLADNVHNTSINGRGSAGYFTLSSDTLNATLYDGRKISLETGDFVVGPLPDGRAFTAVDAPALGWAGNPFSSRGTLSLKNFSFTTTQDNYNHQAQIIDPLSGVGISWDEPGLNGPAVPSGITAGYLDQYFTPGWTCVAHGAHVATGIFTRPSLGEVIGCGVEGLQDMDFQIRPGQTINLIGGRRFANKWSVVDTPPSNSAATNPQTEFSLHGGPGNSPQLSYGLYNKNPPWFNVVPSGSSSNTSVQGNLEILGDLFPVSPSSTLNGPFITHWTPYMESNGTNGNVRVTTQWIANTTTAPPTAISYVETLGEDSPVPLTRDFSKWGEVLLPDINLNGFSSPLFLNGNPGLAGQLLQSNGPGNTPRYVNAISIRAGTVTLTTATSAAVTFSPAMTVTPTDCSLTPRGAPSVTATFFSTNLSPTGFTANATVATSVTLGYQCVVTNGN